MAVTLTKGESGALVRAWLHRLREGEAGDPLAPRLLVAPNLRLGRELTARAARELGAWGNLRVLTIEQLADRIAERVLARSGRRPLDPLARRVLLASLIREARVGYLAPLAGQPGLVQTLDALFADLEEAGFARFPDLAADRSVAPAKAHDLASLYDAFRARIEPTHYTMLDVYETATRRAAEEADALGAGPLAFFGFADLNRAQRWLLSALAGAVDLDLYLPWRDAPPSDYTATLEHFAVETLGAAVRVVEPDAEPATDLACACARFYAEPRSDWAQASADGSVRVLSAPDEVCEAREVVRDVLDAARRGVPLSEIAIAFAGESERALLVEELATAGVPADGAIPEARVPFYVDGGLPARTRSEGLLLERLWDVATDRWRRPEVMQLVRLCPPPALPGPDEEDRPVRADRWDRVTRSIPIVEGWRQWQSRLGAAASRPDDGDPEARADRIAAEQLRLYLAPLIELRRMIEESDDGLATWRQARRVVRGIIPDGEVRVAFLARHAALEAEPLVAQSLRSVDVPGVARSIAEGIALRTGRYRDGTVALIPLQRLRHLSFRHVIVCGLLENRVPAAGRQDPLLLDEERRAINRRFGEQRLPIKGERAAEQVYLFAQALEAARESVTLSYARADREGGRRRVPSHFLSRVAEALGAGAVEQVAGFTRIAAGEPPAGADRWTRPEEMEADWIAFAAAKDRGAAWSNLLGASTYAADALRRRARRTRALLGETALTPYDGDLGTGVAGRIAAPRDALGRPVSATRLETYAACPRRYFLAHAAGLAPLEETGAGIRLDPLEMGELVHLVLRDGFERAMREGLFPVRDETRDGVLAALSDALNAHEERLRREGRLPEPMFWELDKSAVLRDLAAQVDDERERSAGLAPHAFEVRFGPAGRGQAIESDRSVDDPAEVDLGDGRVARFAGRIDRVDAGLARLRVIDYKTGRAPKKSDTDYLKGGEMLQLPVYLEAAARIFPDLAAREVEAYYYHVTAKGGRVLWGIDSEEWRALRPSFARLVGGIADGIAAGLFFPNPAGKRYPDQCSYCPFAAYCGPIRGLERLAARKAESEHRAAYARMKETA